MDTPERYFTTEVHAQEDPPRVVAVGEVDAASSRELEQALETARTGSTVVLDLARVSFIDSSGLRVVTRFARDAVDGGSFEIVGASEAVRRIFEITGLSGLLRDA